MYAKLVNSDLVHAPAAVTVGRTHYNPTPISWIRENGYKPVRYTEAPTEEGKYAVDHWEETEDEIVQTWELLPLPDEISGDEFLARLEEIL